MYMREPDGPPAVVAPSWVSLPQGFGTFHAPRAASRPFPAAGLTPPSFYAQGWRAPALFNRWTLPEPAPGRGPACPPARGLCFGAWKPPVRPLGTRLGLPRC